MQDFAVVTDYLAQSAPQISRGAAPRAPPAITLPLWQTGTRLARQAAQRLACNTMREAALDQDLRARGGEARLVGLVGKQSVVVAACFLLQADDVFVVINPFLIDLLATAEMKVEQPVIACAAFRRWCERRQPGFTDVLEAARSEQLYRGEKRRGLLRRHRKSVRTQQPSEGNKDLSGPR